MTDTWVDEKPGEWVDASAGDGWVDEKPAADTPGIGTRALQLMSKGYKLRDMALANSPDAQMINFISSKLRGKPYEQLVKGKDLKDLFTTWEGGPDAGEYMKRGGVPEGVAGPAGLATDILLPGDPVGMGIGKVVAKGSDLVRAAGLRKLLAKIPWEKKDAALAVLKDYGVGGGAKNISRMTNGALDAENGLASAITAKAGDNGSVFHVEPFMNEGQAIVDHALENHPPQVSNELRQYLDIMTRKAQGGSTISPSAAAKLYGEWGPVASGKGPFVKGLQGINAALRQGVIEGMPEEAGAAWDQAQARQSLLIPMAKAARKATQPALSNWALPLAVGAINGGRQGLTHDSYGNHFSLGAGAMGAAAAALAARGLISPWMLTRSAQAIEAASPLLGNAGAQGLYHLLPEEENK